MNEGERKSQPANQGDVEHLQAQITEIRERANIRHADHEERISNLENVRIGFFGVIAALLFLNLGIGLLIYMAILQIVK